MDENKGAALACINSSWRQELWLWRGLMDHSMWCKPWYQVHYRKRAVLCCFELRATESMLQLMNTHLCLNHTSAQYRVYKIGCKTLAMACTMDHYFMHRCRMDKNSLSLTYSKKMGPITIQSDLSMSLRIRNVNSRFTFTVLPMVWAVTAKLLHSFDLFVQGLQPQTTRHVVDPASTVWSNIAALLSEARRLQCME